MSVKKRNEWNGDEGAKQMIKGMMDDKGQTKEGTKEGIMTATLPPDELPLITYLCIPNIFTHFKTLRRSRGLVRMSAAISSVGT